MKSTLSKSQYYGLISPQTRDIALRLPIFDPKSLRFLCYAGSGYKTADDDEFSQIGSIIVLADKSGKCAIITFSYRKSRRLATHKTTAEGIAIGTGFGASFAIQTDLSMALQAKIPIMMITDSRILFDIITRRRTSTEKRLIIDLKIPREAYAAREIRKIAFIAREDNPADSLTKLKSNKALIQLIRDGRIQHKITQYIFEPAPARK